MHRFRAVTKEIEDETRRRIVEAFAECKTHVEIFYKVGKWHKKWTTKESHGPLGSILIGYAIVLTNSPHQHSIFADNRVANCTCICAESSIQIRNRKIKEKRQLD